jgi:uncharacterized protein
LEEVEVILDLKKVFITENEVLPIEYSMDMSETDYMGDYPLKKPVAVSGRISNKAGLVTISLNMVYAFSAACDRCGLPTETEYKLSLEKSLAPEIEGEDSDSIIPVPNMKLDLEELVYSEILLSLPMKHLCREDCKGICLNCGKNLNEGNCNCNKREVDPRLQALADLLKQD